MKFEVTWDLQRMSAPYSPLVNPFKRSSHPFKQPIALLIEPLGRLRGLEQPGWIKFRP
jgi:hypothetical protein